jgi:hypothetical protein
MKTLEDIAPINAKALSHVETMPENENRDYVRMLLTEPRRCVVGEAHGWQDNYKCKACFGYSISFLDMIIWEGGRYTLDKTQYKKQVKSFMSHWNKKHK